MDKLQYDSLYKFLVSLGVVLIALPIAALIFLANGTMLLISQSDYENLSEYSIHNLNQHNYIVSLIIKFLPTISILFFAAGIVLICVGLIKWHKIQKMLDIKIAAEAKIKELEADKMSNTEIFTKHLDESVEVADNDIITPTTNSVPQYTSQHQRLLKYVEIEDKFFEYGIPVQIKRRYSYRRNIKIGNFSYDAIAVSLKTNVDFIYEVKYWDRIPQNHILQQTVERLHNAGINYKNSEHRNYHCVLAIVSPKDITESLLRRVEVFLEKQPECNYKDVEIKYISEESLISQQ